MNFSPASTTSYRGSSLVRQVDKCRRCSSNNQDFSGEIAIHFTGPKGLDKPIVWVFPKLLVCLACGLTEFTVPERELDVLRGGPAADGALAWPRVD